MGYSSLLKRTGISSAGRPVATHAPGSRLAGTASAPPASSSGSGNPGVQRAQSLLAKHGFDPGVNHGLLDAPTRNAIQSFQRSAGLRTTGVIDSDTNTALHQPPDSAGGAPDLEAGDPLGAHPAVMHSTRTTTTTTRMPKASASAQGDTNMASKRGRAKVYKSTGFRVPLVFTAAIGALASAPLSLNPQMDFRGENIIIDQTVVGPNCTVTLPQVGTIPQIAGASQNNSAVPGTMFPPNQCGALNFKMDIANQGNALSFTATSTLTSTTLNFAMLIFGHEVEEDTGTTAGVGSAGSYAG